MTLSSNQHEFLADDYCAISTEPINAVPAQIIYRQIVINPSDLDKSEYRDTFVPRKYDRPSFNNLVKEIAKRGYSSLYRDPKETSALDLPIYRNSVIIVQLAPADGYCFEVPGIRLKKVEGTGACPTDLYGGLRYVDRQGIAHADYVPKCTLIYFFAEFIEGYVGDPYIQSFLYAVNRLQPRFMSIDPDIRHPGNGGDDIEP